MLIVMKLWVLMLLQFAVDDMPILWDFHVYWFCKRCLRECLYKVHWARQKIENSGEN